MKLTRWPGAKVPKQARMRERRILQRIGRGLRHFRRWLPPIMDDLLSIMIQIVLAVWTVQHFVWIAQHFREHTV